MKTELGLALVAIIIVLIVIIIYLLPTKSRKKYISYYDLCLDEIAEIKEIALRLEHKLRACVGVNSVTTYSSLGYKLSLYNLYRIERLSALKKTFDQGRDAVVEHVEGLVNMLEKVTTTDGTKRLKHNPILHKDVIDFKAKAYSIAHAYVIIMEESHDKYSKDELLNLTMFVEYMVYILTIAYTKWGTVVNNK